MSLVEIRASNRKCEACDLCGQGDGPKPSWGAGRAGLVFVPERHLEIPAGARLLYKLCLSAGIDLDTCLVAPLVRCSTPWGRAATTEEVASCKTWLKKELREMKPRIVVSMGLVPSKLLLGGRSSFVLKDVLGVPTAVSYMTGWIVPTYGIDRLLRGGIKDIKATVKILKACKEQLTR